MCRSIGSVAQGLALRAALLCATLAGLMLLWAGEARATHVSCGQTVTADTTLDSDLTECPGDGIVIGAPNITLDLNGHTVDGSLADGSVGVRNTAGHDGVEITGGIVKHFETGVALDGATLNLLRALRVRTGRTNGIQLTNSDENRIEGCVVFNHRDGISLKASNTNVIFKMTALDNRDTGVDLSESSDNRIEQSSARDNGFYGFRLHFGSGNDILEGSLTDNISGVFVEFSRQTVIQNTSASGNGVGLKIDGFNSRIDDNTTSNNFTGLELGQQSQGNAVRRLSSVGNFDGISAHGGSNFITASDVSGNRNDGIAVHSGPIRVERTSANDNGGSGMRVPGQNALISEVTLHRNGRDGLTLQSIQGVNTITKTSADGNAREGIWLSSSSSNVIELSSADGNGGNGIKLSTGAIKNAIRQNSAVGNGLDGIAIDTDSRQNRIFANRAHRNRDDGIDVDNERTTIGSNGAHFNVDLGIEAVSGVNDAGGNRASGNGNPAQCTNVACS